MRFYSGKSGSNSTQGPWTQNSRDFHSYTVQLTLIFASSQQIAWQTCLSLTAGNRGGRKDEEGFASLPKDSHLERGASLPDPGIKGDPKAPQPGRFPGLGQDSSHSFISRFLKGFLSPHHDRKSDAKSKGNSCREENLEGRYGKGIGRSCKPRTCRSPSSVSAALLLSKDKEE